VIDQVIHPIYILFFANIGVVAIKKQVVPVVFNRLRVSDYACLLAGLVAITSYTVDSRLVSKIIETGNTRKGSWPKSLSRVPRIIECRIALIELGKFFSYSFKTSLVYP